VGVTHDGPAFRRGVARGPWSQLCASLAFDHRPGDTSSREYARDLGQLDIVAELACGPIGELLIHRRP
jgi:hypothetical protein